jgi:hypothetical protein
MAETAPQGNYVGGKKPRKVVTPLNPKPKKRKAKTGGTKHVVASEGGSL